MLVWSDESHLLDRLPQGRSPAGLEFWYEVHGIIVLKRTCAPGSHRSLLLMNGDVSRVSLEDPLPFPL
jgi:hypothetical protein